MVRWESAPRRRLGGVSQLRGLSTIPAKIITCSPFFSAINLRLQLQSGWRRGIIFQFRLQPRSRHGKTVSNDNNCVPCRSILFHAIPCHIILFHYIHSNVIAYKNITKQSRTRNETEHHIILLAWNNKIGFVAHFVGLCAIGQCTLAFVAVRCRCRCVAGWW